MGAGINGGGGRSGRRRGITITIEDKIYMHGGINGSIIIMIELLSNFLISFCFSEGADLNGSSE